MVVYRHRDSGRLYCFNKRGGVWAYRTVASNSKIRGYGHNHSSFVRTSFDRLTDEEKADVVAFKLKS